MEDTMAMTTMPVTTEQVHKAIRVILSDTPKLGTSLNYAVNYCRAGLDMAGNALGVQCLYILNNITGWRHPKGKEVRRILRAFGKAN